VSVALALPDAAGGLALLLRSTLLIGAAWAAATALRKAGSSAAVRHMAWLLGIVALLALPVLWWLVPVLRLPILPADAATAAAAASPASTLPSVLTGSVSPGVAAHSGWIIALSALYALGTATLLLRLIVGRWKLRRLWSDAGTVSDPAWDRLLSRLSSGMQLSRRVQLRISRGPAVPMTWGTLAPKVLLPAEACDWPPERRRLVLLHELAHIARRDSFSRSLASLACALYWFHPGAWFAARQLRMEQEHAADDRVLTAGGSAQAYALNLLHLARGAAARPQFDHVAAMAGMYQLERRLVSITSPARRNRPGAFFLSSSALLGGCTTLLVAVTVPVSATSMRSGSFQAGRQGPAPEVGKDADRRPSENSPAGARPAEPARPGNAARGLVSNAQSASQARSSGPASEPSEVANSGQPRRDRPVRSEGGPANEGSRDGQTLSSYGWELPRRDSRVRIDSSEDPARLARLTLPATRESASTKGSGRPKWARNVPRIVQGAKPMNSPGSTTQGPLMLSWSLGGDRK
jgi:beta-lactamase regulating signal transducer with metallopeptidase domain